MSVPEFLSRRDTLTKPRRGPVIHLPSRPELAAEPSNTAALRLAAALALQRGNLSEAMQAARSAVKLAPHDPACRVSLGDVFMRLGQRTDAIEQLSLASQLAPQDVATSFRLIVALVRDGRLDEAITVFGGTLSLDPKAFAAHSRLTQAIAQQRVAKGSPPSGDDGVIDARLCVACNAFGHALNSLGSVPSSSGFCRENSPMDPTCTMVYRQMFDSLFRSRRMADAVKCLRAIGALDPGDLQFSHLISALTGERRERASAEYCERLFDSYADRYDTSLVRELQCLVPENLAAIMDQLAPPLQRHDILDLGCGTGLVGVAFRHLTESIVGIDLSQRMLEKSRERGIYSSLVKGDVPDALVQFAPNSFDLIVAADVFVYLGSLDITFAEIFRTLRGGGVALFSVEAIEKAELPKGVVDDRYALNICGRFAHSRIYIEKLASQHGFTVLLTEESILRTEQGQPISGYLFALRAG